jgi:hypothetical protein
MNISQGITLIWGGVNTRTNIKNKTKQLRMSKATVAVKTATNVNHQGTANLNPAAKTTAVSRKTKISLSDQ